MKKKKNKRKETPIRPMHFRPICVISQLVWSPLPELCSTSFCPLICHSCHSVTWLMLLLFPRHPLLRMRYTILLWSHGFSIRFNVLFQIYPDTIIVVQLGTRIQRTLNTVNLDSGVVQVKGKSAFFKVTKLFCDYLIGWSGVTFCWSSFWENIDCLFCTGNK